MNIKCRPPLWAVAALALTGVLLAAKAEAAGSGGSGGHGGISLGLGGGLGGGHGAMGIGAGRGVGAGNAGMHLGGRGNLGDRGDLGLGTLGLRGHGIRSAPAGGAISPADPHMGMSPDALPSLKAGRATRADLPSERSAAGNSGKEDVGQHNTKTRRDGAETAAEIEEEELELEQAQQLNSTPTAVTVPGVSAAATTGTTATTSVQTVQATPDPASPTSVTANLGTISAFFAGHGAPVSSVPTNSVNVSVGAVLPASVALFPPPFDLLSQVSDPNFLYFVWGQNVVIADTDSHVVDSIIPDVLAHQD